MNKKEKCFINNNTYHLKQALKEIEKMTIGGLLSVEESEKVRDIRIAIDDLIKNRVKTGLDKIK